MSIFLTLAKVVGGLSVAGLVAGSPFLIQKIKSSTGGAISLQEKWPNPLQKDCLLVWGGHDKVDERESQLIVCKESGVNNTTYYLRRKDKPLDLHKVKGVKTKNSELGTLEITLFSQSGVKKEEMNVHLVWSLGDHEDLKTGCKVAWDTAEKDKQITCHGAKHPKWLNPLS